MEKIALGVWEGTYRGYTIRVCRRQGEPWGEVPRLPTFSYETNLGLRGVDFRTHRAAGSAAVQAIDHYFEQQRRIVVWRWYKERFSESIEDAAALPYRERYQRLCALGEIIYDPGASASDRADARSAYRMIGWLAWHGWFHRIFSETFEAAEAALPDKKAERISKLEALRDDPAASEGEVANAKAALARMRGETAPEAA